jgi:hypothetical protein
MLVLVLADNCTKPSGMRMRIFPGVRRSPVCINFWLYANIFLAYEARSENISDDTSAVLSQETLEQRAGNPPGVRSQRWLGAHERGL